MAMPPFRTHTRDLLHRSSAAAGWCGLCKFTASPRLLGGKVGDIIEFASSIFAYNWRAVTGPGAFNDPDFLVVGCE